MIAVPTVGTSQGFTTVQAHTYDSLNRLKSATETVDTGTQGMMWQQTASTKTAPMKSMRRDPLYDPGCGVIQTTPDQSRLLLKLSSKKLFSDLTIKNSSQIREPVNVFSGTDDDLQQRLNEQD